MTTYLKFFDYDKAFDYYCDAISKMRQGLHKNKVKIIAKPVLILSIIKLIGDGKSVNRFAYDEIEETYNALFGKHFIEAQQMDLTPLYYPYYYLRTDTFWHFTWTNAEVKTESPSKAWIEMNTKYATIDQELWILLSHPTYRQKMTEFILEEKIKKVFTGNSQTAFKSLLQLLLMAI